MNGRLAMVVSTQPAEVAATPPASKAKPGSPSIPEPITRLTAIAMPWKTERFLCSFCSLIGQISHSCRWYLRPAGLDALDAFEEQQLPGFGSTGVCVERLVPKTLSASTSMF